jgi:hypothetical protein
MDYAILLNTRYKLFLKSNNIYVPEMFRALNHAQSVRYEVYGILRK